jgi:capping protein alpha
VSAYVADRYVEGGSAAGAVYSSSKTPNELQVVVSGEKVNLRNFWSGQFSSTWSVVLGADATSVTVAGEVKVRAHYFEEGNVQLQTKKALPAAAVKVAGSDAAAVAKAVADHIAAEERQLQVPFFFLKFFRRFFFFSRFEM